MVKMRHPKSTIATAVSAGLLSLAFGAPASAQDTITNASGSTTVNATNSGSGNVNASGSTTVNASTVSGSGTAVSGTSAPVQTASPSGTTTTASGSGTTAGTSTTNLAVSGAGNTTSTAPATTTNGAVSGSGNVTGTSAPTQSTATGSAPSASSSSTSTSTATATAINDIDIFLPGFVSGGTTITGNNNIVGDNNNVITGNHNTINTSTTTTTAVNGTASGSSAAGSSTASTDLANLPKGQRDRALTLANRDLAAAGITNPTQQQTQAALTGGTVTNGQGQTTEMQGVLTLREQGLGWGQVAHTIGVHPSQSERGASQSMRGFGSDDRVASISANQSHALSRDSGSASALSGVSTGADSRGSGPTLHGGRDIKGGVASGATSVGSSTAIGAAASQSSLHERDSVASGAGFRGKGAGSDASSSSVAVAGASLPDRGQDRGPAVRAGAAADSSTSVGLARRQSHAVSGRILSEHRKGTQGDLIAQLGDIFCQCRSYLPRL